MTDTKLLDILSDSNINYTGMEILNKLKEAGYEVVHKGQLSMRLSTPEDGFQCIYLELNGKEIGVINGQSNEAQRLAAGIVISFNQTAWEHVVK